MRLRLLALLDIPVLERKMVHDTDRLVEVAVAQRELKDLVEARLEGARTERQSGSTNTDPHQRWHENAVPIIARHKAQTAAEVATLRARYEAPVFGHCEVYELVERLGQCIDPSDRRLFGASQLSHVLLMIEAMEADGVLTPDLLLAALIHDLGKLLLLTDEDPANVVGMNAPIGQFEPGTGLDQAVVQWNHDEFGYSRFVEHVPDHIAWLIRYHSVDQPTVSHLYDDRDRRYSDDYLQTFAHYDHETKTPFRAPRTRLEDYREFIEDAFPKPIPF